MVEGGYRQSFTEWIISSQLDLKKLGVRMGTSASKILNTWVRPMSLFPNLTLRTPRARQWFNQASLGDEPQAVNVHLLQVCKE